MEDMRRLALLLLLAPLAACSGDDEGGDRGPSLQERRDSYVEQAEAVCADANEQGAQLGTPTSVAEIPPFADQVLALVRDTVEGVSAIEPPREDVEELEEKVVEPLQADLRTAEEYAASLKAAAEAGDTAELVRLSQELPQTTADTSFMQEYGFDECVEAVELAGAS